MTITPVTAALVIAVILLAIAVAYIMFAPRRKPCALSAVSRGDTVALPSACLSNGGQGSYSDQVQPVHFVPVVLPTIRLGLDGRPMAPSPYMISYESIAPAIANSRPAPVTAEAPIADHRPASEPAPLVTDPPAAELPKSGPEGGEGGQDDKK
jgi:hypothetical protein